MPFLNRSGLNIFYQTGGTTGGRPPVFLTHGYSATSEMWQPNLEALGLQQQVITWDIRGHGQSDSPEDLSLYSTELSVADMEAILNAYDVEKAVVGGLSLGGYLSLEFFLAHPERVRALMLFDTGPGFKKDEAREAWNRTAEDRALAFETRGLEALPDRPEVGRSRHRSAFGLAQAARGILVQHDARVIKALASINVPTLILVGELDTPFLAAAAYMAAKIPGARKAVIEQAGHASNIDQPDAFNRVVLDFLESLE
ncbi:MAG: alpha/beta fold hydrolase [Thermodesulfobacteriota bacterium]